MFKHQLFILQTLYDTLCRDLESEEATLLLYKLLHENAMMKAFILSRTNIDKLIEPLLKVGKIHHSKSPNQTVHALYEEYLVISAWQWIP